MLVRFDKISFLEKDQNGSALNAGNRECLIVLIQNENVPGEGGCVAVRRRITHFICVGVGCCSEGRREAVGRMIAFLPVRKSSGKSEFDTSNYVLQ